MKQLAKYKVNFESKWILLSVALAGFACFFQAVYFFVLNKPQDATSTQLAFFLIIPMVLELAWVIMLHSVKKNAPGIYGILGSLLCVMLLVQSCIAGGTWNIVVAALGYVLACGALVMITGGFFPYKYIGLAYFGILLVVRMCMAGMPGMIQLRNWTALMGALPEICVIGALLLFFWRNYRRSE